MGMELAEDDRRWAFLLTKKWRLLILAAAVSGRGKPQIRWAFPLR